MFRPFVSLFCWFAFALQVLVIAGCAGSTSKMATGSGGGNSPSPSASSACGGSGHGYDNTSGVSVWLQTPSPGQNPSHVQVTATANASVPITRWAVCLDDQAVYLTSNPSSSVSRGIDMSTGQHLLYARAWDANGKSNRSEVKLIPVGPRPASSTVLPTPPANAQVLKHMQNEASNWSICSICAAGTNTTGNYWMAPFQKQPSRSGSSLEMYADGPQWSNVLFMDKILGTNSDSNFL